MKQRRVEIKRYHKSSSNNHIEGRHKKENHGSMEHPLFELWQPKIGSCWHSKHSHETKKGEDLQFLEFLASFSAFQASSRTDHTKTRCMPVKSTRWRMLRCSRSSPCPSSLSASIFLFDLLLLTTSSLVNIPTYSFPDKKGALGDKWLAFIKG